MAGPCAFWCGGWRLPTLGRLCTRVQVGDAGCGLELGVDAIVCQGQAVNVRDGEIEVLAKCPEEAANLACQIREAPAEWTDPTSIKAGQST